MAETLTITIRLNGAVHKVPAGTTLLGLLEQQAILRPGVPLTRQGIAVECNGTVVSSRQWGQTPLADGDTLEIVTAFPGG